MAAKKRGGAPIVHSVAGKRVLGHATVGHSGDRHAPKLPSVKAVRPSGQIPGKGTSGGTSKGKGK
jgi:hypothetical protein